MNVPILILTQHGKTDNGDSQALQATTPLSKHKERALVKSSLLSLVLHHLRSILPPPGNDNLR